MTTKFGGTRKSLPPVTIPMDSKEFNASTCKISGAFAIIFESWI
jgi:hypothetical protein